MSDFLVEQQGAVLRVTTNHPERGNGMTDAPAAPAPAKPLAAAAQPARFLVVGAGGYAVNLAIFAGLHTTGLTYVLNSIVSYFIANALM